MRTVRAEFKNGVFVPEEELNLPEGTEAIVVFRDTSFEGLNLSLKEREAVKELSKRIKGSIVFRDMKLCRTESGFEVFVIVDSDEVMAVRTVMDEALKVYRQHNVHLPIQVISSSRLKRWKEQGNSIYEEIVNGVSIK